MTGNSYVILAYVVGLTLLWGYAAGLWYGLRRAARSNEVAPPRES